MIQLYCKKHLFTGYDTTSLTKRNSFHNMYTTTYLTQPPNPQPTSLLHLVLIPKSSILLIRQILKRMHSIFIFGLGNSRAGNLVAFGIAPHQSNA